MTNNEFKGFVRLSSDQYAELKLNGSLVIEGRTIEYSPLDTIYLVANESAIYSIAWAEYGITTYAQITEYLNDKKIVLCNYNNDILMLSTNIRPILGVSKYYFCSIGTSSNIFETTSINKVVVTNNNEWSNTKLYFQKQLFAHKIIVEDNSAVRHTLMLITDSSTAYSSLNINTESILSSWYIVFDILGLAKGKDIIISIDKSNLYFDTVKDIVNNTHTILSGTYISDTVYAFGSNF